MTSLQKGGAQSRQERKERQVRERTFYPCAPLRLCVNLVGNSVDSYHASGRRAASTRCMGVLHVGGEFVRRRRQPASESIHWLIAEVH